MDFPKYTKSNSTGQKGLTILTKIVEKELGWVVRPNHQETDFGIDVYLDVTINEFVTGKSIAAQLKSGNSYLKELDDDFWLFTGEKKHLNYYLNHDIPVLIILVDVDNEIAYWETCKPEYISLAGNDSWSMPIPKRQQINSSQKEELTKYVSKTIDYVSHFEAYWAGNQILSEHDFMCIIIGKEDIERKNYRPLAELIDRLCSNKQLLSHYKERIDIGIHGYDNEHRELYEIKEVRAWILDVFANVPGLSYFLSNNKHAHFLKLFFLSNIHSTETRVRIGNRYFTPYSSEEITTVVNILFSDLNQFTRSFHIAKDVNLDISKHMVECLTGKNFEV